MSTQTIIVNDTAPAEQHLTGFAQGFLAQTVGDVVTVRFSNGNFEDSIIEEWHPIYGMGEYQQRAISVGDCMSIVCRFVPHNEEFKATKWEVIPFDFTDC